MSESKRNSPGSKTEGGTYICWTLISRPSVCRGKKNGSRRKKGRTGGRDKDRMGLRA